MPRSLAFTSLLLALASACGGRTTLDDSTTTDSGTELDAIVGVDVSGQPDSSFVDVVVGPPDGGVTVDSGPPNPPIPCGTSQCDPSTEVCCVTFGGQTLSETCTAPTACNGAALTCASAANCPLGDVCCANFSQTTPGSQCALKCQGGFQNPQLCALDSECPTGETCKNGPFGLKICRH